LVASGVAYLVARKVAARFRTFIPARYGNPTKHQKRYEHAVGWVGTLSWLAVVGPICQVEWTHLRPSETSA